MIRSITAGLMLIGVWAFRAQGQTAERHALDSIRVVKVAVERLPSEATSIGLDTADLRTQAELHLRDHGLRITKDNDWDATIYVNVNVLAPTGGPRAAAASVDVELHRWTLLPTRGHSPVMSTVWDAGGLAIGTPETVHQQVVSAVGADIDRFVNEWLAAKGR